MRKSIITDKNRSNIIRIKVIIAALLDKGLRNYEYIVLAKRIYGDIRSIILVCVSWNCLLDNKTML